MVDSDLIVYSDSVATVEEQVEIGATMALLFCNG